MLLVEAEGAIQKLVSVKARIAAELARQIKEAPSKTIGAKKRKVLSSLDREERKTITDLDQHFREKIFGEPKNPNQRRRSQNQPQSKRNPRTRPSF